MFDAAFWRHCSSCNISSVIVRVSHKTPGVRVTDTVSCSSREISYGLIGRFSNGQLLMGWSRFLRATTPRRARQGPTFVHTEIRCTSFPVPSPSLAPASGTFYLRTLENMMRVRLDGPVVLCQSSDLRHMLRLRGMRLSPNLRKGSGSRAH